VIVRGNIAHTERSHLTLSLECLIVKNTLTRSMKLMFTVTQ